MLVTEAPLSMPRPRLLVVAWLPIVPVIEMLPDDVTRAPLANWAPVAPSTKPEVPPPPVIEMAPPADEMVELARRKAEGGPKLEPWLVVCASIVTVPAPVLEMTDGVAGAGPPTVALATLKE